MPDNQTTTRRTLLKAAICSPLLGCFDAASELIAANVVGDSALAAKVEALFPGDTIVPIIKDRLTATPGVNVTDTLILRCRGVMHWIMGQHATPAMEAKVAAIIDDYVSIDERSFCRKYGLMKWYITRYGEAALVGMENA